MSKKSAYEPGGRAYEKRKAQNKNKRRAALGGRGTKSVQERNAELERQGKAPAAEAGSDGSSSDEEAPRVQGRQPARAGELPPADSSEDEGEAVAAGVGGLRLEEEEEEEDEAPRETRKEREARLAEEKRQAYLKATREGKTPEARKDLERLAELRKKRELAAQRKEQTRAEKEAAALEQKRLAIAGGRKQ